MKILSYLLLAVCAVLEIAAYVRLQLFLTKSAEETAENSVKGLIRHIGTMVLIPLVTALLAVLLKLIG